MKFLDIPLICENHHHTKTFPSDWNARVITVEPAELQKLSSNTHVLVKRAILFLLTQFIVVNAPHTNTLPSDCIATVRIEVFVKLHVNVWSTAHVLVKRAK